MTTDADLRAGNKCSDFLLFIRFPGNEVFDIRVVNVEHDHLRSAACCAA